VPFSKPPLACHPSRLTPHALPITHHASRITHHAFTLVEILVTVALLAFITLGLFAALDQVQRAFRSGMSQVDRLEAGRAVTELLPREIEQATPCGANAVTFSAQIIGSSAPTTALPLTQSLPGMPAATMRTNLLEDCFILTRQNQTWVGIGYCVRVSDATGRLYLPTSGPGQLGVGSLYRYTASTNVLRNDGPPYTGLPSDPGQLYANFSKACVSGSPASLAISNRICDGVIHFYLTTYAPNGFPIVAGTRFGTNVAIFRPDPFSILPQYPVVHPVLIVPNSSYPGNLAALYFISNAVPASVGMELGILEQPTWERYNSIPAPAARLAYLQRPDVTSRVHLFRQRIPIRNVDPSAYQ
jgi:prepilin-type N-terminal cleavage/methylation domain-containing protein